MVKRFRIPPPILDRKSFGKKIDVELSDDKAAEANSGLRETGLLALHEIVCSQWLPFALKKLDAASSNTVVPAVGVEQGFHSVHDWGEALCRVMALFYLGKRIGNFRLVLEEDGGGADAGSEIDGTVPTISSTLDGVADLVGERVAVQIFRKLESVTDRVVSQTFGERRAR